MNQFVINTPELILGGQEILAPSTIPLREGEIHAILGKSGVGKSQLLKLIADSVHDVSFVFQRPNLFPWLTLQENLRVALPAEVSQKEILNLLERFDLYQYRDLYPSEISVGMQQKCNLARAILSSSKLILMDEPFSALDYFQKEDIRSFVKNIFNEFKRSVILVTHDIEEAVFLSKKLFLLKGRPARLTQASVIAHFDHTNYKDIRYQNEFIESCNLLRESFEC